MSDILRDLRNADIKGVHPPQNWTTRAADEIERLRIELCQAQPASRADLFPCGNCGHGLDLGYLNPGEKCPSCGCSL